MSVFSSFISHQGFILTLSGCFINVQSFTEGESWENLQCFTVNIISELLSKRWSICNFSWASITKLLGGQRGLSWRSNLINKENAPIKNHILPEWIREKDITGNLDTREPRHTATAHQVLTPILVWSEHKLNQSFSYLGNLLINTVTPFIQPDFCDPLVHVAGLTEFYCYDFWIKRVYVHISRSHFTKSYLPLVKLFFWFSNNFETEHMYSSLFLSQSGWDLFVSTAELNVLFNLFRECLTINNWQN